MKDDQKVSDERFGLHPFPESHPSATDDVVSISSFFNSQYFASTGWSHCILTTCINNLVPSLADNVLSRVFSTEYTCGNSELSGQ